jgi:hypothetical protein
MKHIRTHRPAAAALFAAAVFSTAPVFAQDTTTIATPPPVVTIAPPPPALTPAPAPAPAPAPPPVVSTAPPAAAPAPVRAATPAPAPRAVTRTNTVRTRQAAPVRQSAPARAAPPPVQAQPAPSAAPAPAPAPVAEVPVPPALAPAPVPVTEAAPAPVQEASRPILSWLLAGAAVLIAAIGLLLFMRRRRDEDEVYEESVYEEPVIARSEPVAREYQPTIVPPQPIIARTAPVADAVPVAAAAVAEAAPDSDAVTVTESDSSEMETLADGSRAPANRPWIELLMKPVRAGTSKDDAIVQFELTVGNTGSVDAKDVRISTWMFAAGSPGASEMERMLIQPPADATVSNVDIDAGEGARVEAEIALPTAGMEDGVLPVVVADARYRLPDGSEGRTSASFAIGLPDGEELSPFPTDRASGLRENAEARLHGEPQRV